METGAIEAVQETRSSGAEPHSSRGGDEQCPPWAGGRIAVVASGLFGLFLLALHGCGIEPSQLLNGCLNLLIGWFRGASWVANHWETWAAIGCIWVVAAAAVCDSLRAALRLLCQFPPTALLAFGAARALWVMDPVLGWAVALLAFLGVLLLVIVISIDLPQQSTNH